MEGTIEGHPAKPTRTIAFYLPQFHPIPENDEWWGKGFTEWTNVKKARSLYPGHYQPRVPDEPGYYDLRDPDVRQHQAALAREYGIEGFCYWHYWFAGRRILESPFQEVLESGKPDFPFCLAWANESWTGIWHGAPGKMLIEQTYPGKEDYENHFYAVLPAFRDPRYIRVGERPVFLVYQPSKVPDCRSFVDQWQALAVREGLSGIHFVGIHQDKLTQDPTVWGLDAICYCNLDSLVWISFQRWLRAVWRTVFPNQHVKIHKEVLKRNKGHLLQGIRNDLFGLVKKLSGWPPKLYRYKDMMPFFLEKLDWNIESYPCVIPDWDNSPRSERRGRILDGSTPELFRKQVREARKAVDALPDDRRFVFVKSWNEWAEGNHLEPDMRHGTKYLEVIREELADGSGV